MNRKQFSILIVLVIVLGAAGLAIYNRQNQGNSGGSPVMGKKLLGDFPVNDVTQLSIKQGANEVNLAKKDDLWRVRERKDYPANYSEISDFLLKARDLKIVQTEEVGPSSLGQVGLVLGSGTNAATTIEFRGEGGKVLRTLLLGKKHMRKSSRPSPMGEMGEDGWPDGRYVKLGDNNGIVSLISEALANIEPRPEQWLNKDFFKVEKPKTVAVTFPAETNSWKLSRETENGEWKLEGAKPEEKLDAAKASGATGGFSSPSFNDVVTNAQPQTLGLDRPTVVTVETFDGFTYTVKVGQKTNDVCAITVSVGAKIPTERTPGKEEKPEDKSKLDKEFKESTKKLEDKLAQEKAYEPWVYMVSSWTVDSVLKERAQLLVEKKEEPKKDAKPADNAADATLGQPADTTPAATDGNSEK